MNKKNIIIRLIPPLVICIICFAYFFGWEVGSYFHKDSTATDIIELTREVNAQIDEGRERGSFYIKNISIEELENINDNICGLNGQVSKYSVLDSMKGGKKIMLTYEISDNYYVYRRYKYNETIPGDRPCAYKLYEKVVSIISEVTNDTMTDYEKELAIHDYLVKNCEYGFVDYSQDYAYRAYGALVQKQAVCNGYAEAMALLLSCVDVENKIMTGMADGELHAWNAVKLDDKWYQVDSTWDDPLPDRGSYAGHAYFNITDELMDARHDWDKTYYGFTCNSMDYNYYLINDAYGNYSDFKEYVETEAVGNPSGIIEVAVTDYNEDSYDFDFIFGISGISVFKYSVEDYGDDSIITIYLNEK